MSILDLINKLPGRRYSRVPRDWTYIYHRLFRTYGNQFTSREAIVHAASLIATDTCYLDIIHADDIYRNCSLFLEYSKGGCCGPVYWMRDLPYSWCIQHGEEAFFTDSGEASLDLIVNYCVQYCASYLVLDLPMYNERDVFEACVDAKSTMIKSIITLGRELVLGKANIPKLDNRISLALEGAKEWRKSNSQISVLLSALLKSSLSAT